MKIPRFAQGIISVIVFCFTLVLIGPPAALARPQGESAGKEYPLRLQPELDVLDIESYLKNPRLVKLQVKCILYDGPCDVVGKWAKPRVKAGLLGECLMCTEKQKGWLTKWLDILIKNEPDLYRAGVAKFLLNSGVDIPEEEAEKIAKHIEQGLGPLNLTDTETETDPTTATVT